MNSRSKIAVGALLDDAAWMSALARRLVGDRERAADAVQDAWVVGLEARTTPPTSPRKWIAGVVGRLARHRWRGDRARERRERAVARPEATESTADVIERAHAQRELVDAVLALGEPAGSTILLHYFDGLSAEEIARRQGIPSSTVRSRLARGLDELRARLERQRGGAWSALLVPLARDGGGVTLAVAGGIAVGTALKIGAGVAAATLVGWLLWPDGTAGGVPASGGLVAGADSLRLAAAEDDAAATRSAVPPGVGAPVASVPAEAATGTTSLLVRVTWEEGSAPAVDAVVELIPWGAPDPFACTRAGTTGDDGAVLFDEVAPGLVAVRCAWGPGRQVTLERGRRTELQLAISPGIVVEGEVVDGDGRAVADAAIWLSDYANGHDGHVVARSGRDGRFRLRSIEEARRVAARARGFAPSPSYDVDGSPGDVLHPRIVLSAPGGALEGVVRGPDGGPLANALVQAGREGTHSIRDPQGRWLSTPPPVRVRTDSDGRFALDSLALGRAPVVVRAPGLAPWRGVVEILEVGTGFLEIACSAGAVVRGVIRDALGGPAADVFVGHGGYGEVASAQTRSLADGSFRLEGLPAGSIDVRANDRAKGTANSEIELIAGAEVEWSPTLVAGRGHSGRVLREDGEPLPNWMVGAVAPDHPGLHKSSARTDATGAFRLENCPADAPWIEVREPDSWTGEAALTVRDVPTGGEELVLRVPRSAIASAFLEGRLSGPGGPPAEGARVLLRPEGARGSFGQGIDPGTGAFRIGPLKPGRYRISFEAPGLGPRSLPTIDLAPEQQVDLGEVRLELAGFVRVVLVEPAGWDLASGTRASVLGPDGRAVASVEFEGREGRSDPLGAGTYSIRVHSGEARADDQPVVVLGGQETAVEIRLEPATARIVAIELPEGVEATLPVRVAIRDSAEKAVLDVDLVRQPGRPLLVFVPGLGTGTYRAEASTTTGLAGELRFAVADLSPVREHILLRLR